MPLLKHVGPIMANPAPVPVIDAAEMTTKEAVQAGKGAVLVPDGKSADRPKTSVESAETSKPVYTGRKASSDTMSKEEWAAKDRRIGRAGLYQAALQSVGVLQYSPDVRTFEDYLKAVRKAAEDGLRFVNEVAE